MGNYIAVDIGGTHIRTAAFEKDNPAPLSHQRVRSYAKEPGIFDRLVNTIQSVWPKVEPVIAIGMAAPGPLDPHAGVILATPNIPEWHDFPLAEKLSQKFDVPVYLNNDANLGALGEWKFGAGRGHHDVLYLTVSTGIGGGVIIQDRLLQGYHGLAAELGHVTVLAGGPTCSCGFKGHLEALASGPAIVRYVQEQLQAGVQSELKEKVSFNARDVAEAAGRGDALARAAYARAGEYLGISIASFLHTFDPSIVILGGGVSQSGSLLFEPVEASLKANVLNPHYLKDLVITPAALGDDAGLLGSLALAQMAQSDSN
jgi:glucokinase